jgi:hypothetical protein
MGGMSTSASEDADATCSIILGLNFFNTNSTQGWQEGGCTGLFVCSICSMSSYVIERIYTDHGNTQHPGNQVKVCVLSGLLPVQRTAVGSIAV